ncbi:MAG: PAS domain S-box protein [Snowella sp.]|nr:PAS domain S-box protein [Snowella sp.]
MANSLFKSVSNSITIKLLGIDSQFDVLNEIKTALSSDPYELIWVNTAAKTQEALDQFDWAAILINLENQLDYGLELIQFIRQQPRSRSTPILLLVPADFTDFNQIAAQNLGIFDYLVRPIHPDLLRVKLAFCLEYTQQNLQLEHNQALLAEKCEDCQTAQTQLKTLNSHLATLVEQQTQALTQQNQLLQQQIQEKEQLTLEYRQSEQRLRESEERLLNIINHISDGLLIVNEREEICFLNPSAEVLFGRPKEELLGINLGFLIAENLTEITFLHPSRELRIAEMKGTEIMWHGERAYLASLRDITSRKQIESELAELLQRLSDLEYAIDQSAIVVITDPEGTFTYVNDKFSEISQYSRFDLIGKTPALINSGYHPPEFWKNLWDTISDGQIWRGEIYNKAKDGSYYWIDSTIVPFISNDDKQVWQYLSINFDITERKQAEEALYNSEQKYLHFLENVQSCIIVHAPNTEIIFINQAAVDFLGIRKEELLGKDDQASEWNFFNREGELLSPEEFPVNQVIREKCPLYDYELRFYSLSKNNVYWCLLNAYPEFDEEGELVQVIVTFIDITERKKSELALQDSNEQLEIAIQERTIALAETNAHLLREIREREQIDLSLREEEAKYRALMKDASDAILLLDINQTYIEMNQKAEALLGYGRENMLQRQRLELIFSEFEESPIQLWQTLLERGFIAWNDQKIRAKTGLLIPVDITANVIDYADKRIIQVIIRDVTERKQAEDALQKSEDQFRAIFEYSAIGIALINPLGHAFRVNTTLESMLGYSHQVLAERVFTEFTHPEDSVRDWRLFQQLITGQRESYQIEKRYLRSDGQVLWGLLTASLVCNAKGYPQFAVQMIEDITDRKQAEKALQQNQLFLRNVIDANPNLIFVKNSDGFYVLANQAIATAYGKTVEEVIGKTDQALNRNLGQVQQFQRYDQQVLRSRQPLWIAEETILIATGEARIFQSLRLPMIGPDGRAEHVLGVSTDITELKRAEEEMQNALHKERELSEMKSQFVDIVSHEFRTPLTSIVGFAELLERHHHKMSLEKQRRYLQNIQQAGYRLRELIEDILSVSRADSGKLQFTPLPLNMAAFCQELLEEFQVGAGKDHEFHFYCEGTVPTFSLVDERLLRHILTNLLGNAVKYSPNRTLVEFGLIYHADQIHFQIRDRGIGIPVEDQIHLFESFHRASNVGNIPGTGLGLNIVKRYAELHHGTISFHSTVGEGSTFTLIIPAQELSPNLLH